MPALEDRQPVPCSPLLSSISNWLRLCARTFPAAARTNMMSEFQSHGTETKTIILESELGVFWRGAGEASKAGRQVPTDGLVTAPFLHSSFCFYFYFPSCSLEPASLNKSSRSF